ncbi:serpin family protein [Eggerthella timonensis]|uniref:serpin family protein n=1 Tax=Eggerthella timonensis TaxID=1871008 RepID=UPI000C769783|nr:serpin family protein [Eggerthella timonensis]
MERGKRQANRGDGLTWKALTLFAALATLLAASALLGACTTQQSTIEPAGEPTSEPTGERTGEFAVAQPAMPQKASEDDPEAWLDTLEKNPVDQPFVESLSAFAYRSSASVLGGAADDGGEPVADDPNRMYSPLSLYYALALANEGAAGQTRDEIDAVLGAPAGVSVPEQCGNLFRVLATDPFSTVDLANSIWMAKDNPFEQSFVDTATGQFYATPFSVEFGTEATDRAMAAWISEKTGGTIDPQVKTERDLLLSIINTVYFKGSWTDPFDAASTASATFHAAAGDVETDFMTQRIDSLQGYRRTDDFLRASLAFTGGTMMTFVLPNEGVSVDDLLSDEQRLAEAFAVDANEDEYGFITYVVPKAAFDTEFDLIPALERLGMEAAFDDRADFSNLTSTPAYISMVKQESHIAWDEEGAEASAYTNIGISEMSAMIPEGDEVELRLDRPFLFQITSSQGIPLFVGVCGNPAAEA